ncbi:MAG: D-aminoacyl-tRNA deacylase [Promethearchaeota archaeon]
MPIIIVSNQDLAGQNIKEKLLEIGNFKEASKEFEGNIIYEETKTQVPIITTNRKLIETDHLNRFFKTDLFIFASKHKSESERPSLLVHAPGNFGDDNSYGGNVRELALTSATVIKQVLIDLTRKRDETQLEYEVTSEVTHHGPTNLDAPCVFIELGSNEIFWRDPQGARIVAEIILNLINKSSQKSNLKYAIGFGGPHYATNFNKVQLNTNYAISHIAAKYVLDTITKELVIQAINKTVENISYAIFDWKGMVKAHRDKIIKILNDLGIEILKVRKILAH